MKKGGKLHTMPRHHNLEQYLADYIVTAGIGNKISCHTFRATKTAAISRSRSRWRITNRPVLPAFTIKRR